MWLVVGEMDDGFVVVDVVVIMYCLFNISWKVVSDKIFRVMKFGSIY